MRVLVTGGAGFIGSHLTERLLGEGHQVLALDSFLTGSEDNVRHLMDHPRFTLLRQDVTLPLLVEVDRIYNLACPASPVHYQRDPIKTTQTNVLGALNVLALATRTSARVLQASTSEVYGDPLVHPQTEDYWGHVNPHGKRSCYDEGKRVAESLMMSYHRQYGVEVRIARIFNTYGPRMAESDGRVVSNFIVQTLRGREVTVYGTGEQTRSFCFVADMVDGLVRLMESNGTPGPVNLGNPTEQTVLELAHLVAEIAGVEPRIRFLPLPEDDPRQRRPDICRAKQLLGWSPRITLENGLRRTIADFAARLPARQPAAPRTAVRRPHQRPPGEDADRPAAWASGDDAGPERYEF
jgi:UDP-glucuronate decarboxylase